MAKTRIKEWDAGEVLTATDLNAEIDNMNGTGVAFPLTENVSAAGYEVSNAKLVTLKQLNDNVVTMDNYASFAAAITAIGSTVTTLLINSNVNVTANATVPSTCTLWFLGQGKLTVSVAVTCTINGPIIAGPRQIFAGSGTVAFTSNYSLPAVYPEWWGENTTPGTTDMTAEIQAAYTSISAVGGTVKYLPTTYKISSSITVYSNITTDGNGATIDATALGELDPIFTGSGTVGSSLTLSSNGAAGASTLSMSAVTGLAAGDPLYISANTLLPAGTSGIYIGEWNTAKSISGTTVTLARPLDGTYATADSAYVKEISPLENMTFRGLKLIGSGRNATDGVEGQVGISLTYARNVRIERCQFIKVDYQPISIDWVDTATVLGNYIRHDDEGSTNTTSVQYGIVPKGGSRSILIAGNHIIGGKHGIAGSRNTNHGIHRDITIVGNTIEGTWHAGITSHDNMKRAVITGNHLIGCQRGIEVRVQDVIVSDNVIENVGSTLGEGIAMTEFPSRITIRGNRVKGATYGVRMYDTGLEASAVPVDVIIDGNSFQSLSNTAIYLEHTENTTDKTGWAILNNVIQLPASAYGVYLAGTFYGAMIQGNRISTSDASTANQGIYLLGGQHTVVKDNYLDKTAGIRIATEPTTSDVPDGVMVRNNVCTNMKTGFFAVALVNGTNFDQDGNIGGTATTLTIASGAVTASQYYHILDTEGAAATDDLDTINGGASLRGRPVVFKAANGARDVVLKDGTGNLKLNGDCTLDNTEDSITLLFDGSNWIETARSNNGA